jgi:Zn-dependent protease
MRGEIEFEILFQQTKADLIRRASQQAPFAAASKDAPTRPGRPLVWLAVSLVLFALSFLNQGLRWTGILILVVGLHEVGHFLAMRWFGYRDVRMFFLPFFGGMVIGRREDAPPWQRAVVALAGPLPGLLLGLVLYVCSSAPLESWLFQFVLMSMALNAFNLLPVMPLDGGRFFEILFLAKRPWSGTIFRAFAIAVLIAGAIYFDSIITKLCLGMTALFVLMSTPFAHRAARSRQTVSELFPNLPETIVDVPDEVLRELFKVSLAISLTGADLDPQQLSATMRDLHVQASQRSLGGRRGGAMLALYVLGWAITLAWVGLVVRAELGRNRAAQTLIDTYFTMDRMDGMADTAWQSAEPTVRNRAIRRIREEYPIPNDDPQIKQTRIQFELFVVKNSPRLKPPNDPPAP